MSMPTNAPHMPLYADGAEQAVRRMSVEDIARLQASLAKAGLIGPSTKFRVGMPDSTTVSAYKKLLETANNYAITDVEALDLLATKPQATGSQATGGTSTSGGSAGGASAAQDLSRTETQTRTDDPVFTDPMTARATLRGTLSDRLGRDPTADEYHKFRTLLSNEEGGQDTTTTVTKYGKRGQVKSSRSTPSDRTTDPSADVIADDMSRTGKLGKEANTFQAATGFFGVLDRLTGG